MYIYTLSTKQAWVACVRSVPLDGHLSLCLQVMPGKPLLDLANAASMLTHTHPFWWPRRDHQSFLPDPLPFHNINHAKTARISSAPTLKTPLASRRGLATRMLLTGGLDVQGRAGRSSLHVSKHVGVGVGFIKHAPNTLDLRK